MALILQNCRLLHTPKTGGSWACTAVKNSGAVFAETKTRHVELKCCPGVGLYTIAFVRHPWNWWKSYWIFKRTHGWDFNNSFDVRCMDNNFEQFLLKVLENSPGHCSNVFRRFVGAIGHEISFIGVFENLADDLVKGLTIAGEHFNEQTLRATPTRNRGNYQAFSTHCSNEIHQRILETEREALERFDYQSYPGNDAGNANSPT
jgi:hypothetical protein